MLTSLVVATAVLVGGLAALAGADAATGGGSSAGAAMTVTGLALNNVPGDAASGAYMLRIESGSGAVTSYAVGAGQPQVLAGDIVGLTLNTASGTAAVIDYSTNNAPDNAVPLFGTVTYPALITGVLGTEIQIQPTGGPAMRRSLDLYLARNTPVFGAPKGGGYRYSRIAAISGDVADTTRVAPAAGTAPVGVLQPGFLVSVGADPSGRVQGVLYLSGAAQGGSPHVPISVVLEDGAVQSLSGRGFPSSVADVAVVSARVGLGDEPGTAQVAPMGAAAPLTVLTPPGHGTGLAAGAGTTGSVFQVQSVGPTLVQYAQPVCGAPVQALSVAPAFSGCAPTAPPAAPAVPTPPATGLTFGGLTSLGGGRPGLTAGGRTFAYGPGTVVLNVPGRTLQPIGSLVPGQQVVVFYEDMPEDGAAPLAVFVEVVSTAPAASATGTGGSMAGGSVAAGR